MVSRMQISIYQVLAVFQLSGFILPLAGKKRRCNYCNVSEAYRDLLIEDDGIPPAQPTSTVYNLHSTHIQIIPTAAEHGGFLSKEIIQSVAMEAINGWKDFRDNIRPSLPLGHDLAEAPDEEAGQLNHAFYFYQRNLFERGGDLKKALMTKYDEPLDIDGPNTSWPAMNANQNFHLMKDIISKASRGYLERSGMDPAQVAKLKYSLFHWVAINGPGEYHGQHAHTGEYHVGVFYAQVEEGAGKIIFYDPRGYNPPFGRTFVYQPRAGDIVLFPSWLSHMATVTAPTAAGIEGEVQKRVIFSFNIGPKAGPLPCNDWYTDPTRNMRFSRRVPIDLEELDL
eukprot:TRINITY_DN49681_c0_g1_i1.p1 TRINITY_DN49681_c0_g1~~TRINITY_DN49681_c0_g1_i1.p1  ORF type:complete len:352 (+),score=44.66 TRINITY_DN49681_c0_g1_i1:41-1057(+)